MKYVKPMVEVINIENEDIIVASLNIKAGPPCYGTNGAEGSPNSASAMNCSGTGYFCYDGLGGQCTAMNGLRCSSQGETACLNLSQGTGEICYTTGAGLTHRYNCSALIGIN